MERSRRGILAATATAAIAGCIQTTDEVTREQWLNDDDFPSDDSRNRHCDVRDPGPYSRTLQPQGHGHDSLLIGVDGREGMHGTNHHSEVEIEADHPVDVYVTADESIGNEVDTTNIDTENESTGNETDTDNHGESLELIQQIDELTELGVTEYNKTLRVPDEDKYTIIILPPEREESERSIEVNVELECSYYLRFEEYEEIHS